MYKSLRLLFIILLGCQLSSIAQTSTYSVPGIATYVVPPGVTGVTVNVKGAVGGLNSAEADYPDRRGYGGCVQAVITVTPGQILRVRVGGRGGDGTATAGGTGGFNGGGAGEYGISVYSGGGGGGASDIRLVGDGEGDRLVVAGGGGGAGLNCGGDDDRGGDGGPLPAIGGDGAGCGTTTGGGGGTPTGGAGGVCSTCIFPGTGPGFSGTTTDGGAGGPVSAGGGGGGGFGGGGGGQYSGGGGGGDFAGAPSVALISDTRGCNTSGDGSVTITVSCTAGSISGPGAVCVGSVIHLTDGVSGGTWVSGDPLTATVSTTGDVTGVAAGVVMISYQLSPGVPGCRAVKSITVNPLPAPISGSAFSVCVGSTMTVTDPDPGYVWSSTNNALATVTSGGVVTGVGPGDDSIAYTNPATGCATYYYLLVNPIPAPIAGPTRVCELASITLTDPDPGLVWSWATVSGGGAVTITSGGVVTGSAGGVVKISYTLPSGCAATYLVTVDPIPAPITGLSTVCMGSTITLASLTTGGTWTSSTAGVIADIGSSSGIVTPIAPGTTTVITYTTTLGCSRTRTVTVYALPAALTGTAVICEGSTTIFTSPTGSGTWVSGTTTIATVTIGPSTTTTVTGVGVSGGVSDITFTLSSTGCKVSREVTVNPRPEVITGPTSMCTGFCDTMRVGATTGGTWTSSSTGVATIDPVNGYVCALTAGSTTIRYTLPSGCFRQITLVVNTTPAPITGPTSVCIGSTITLSDATALGTWSSTESPDTITIGGGSGVVTGEGAGVATVTYTLSSGCRVFYTVTVNPLPDPITGPTDVCVGDSILLSDPVTGGTWTSGLTAVASVNPTTGYVTGVAGGIAVITYTLSTGCYVVHTVNVRSLPSIISPPYSMCLGAASYLISSGGGTGVWTSSMTSVAIVTATGPATASITPTGVGVTTICYTFDVGLACASCHEFTVNPIPAAITGPSTVCTGATITLASTTTGGIFTATNGRATVTAVGGVVTGISPGADTIIYTANGCSVTKVITVNQSPAAITGTLAICLGQTTVLSDATGGGSWSATPITGSATLTPVFSTTTTVTSVTAGTVTIRYTNGFTGCFAQAILTINTLATPIVGPSTVCTGSTILLTESVGGIWSSSNTAVGTIGSTTGVVGGISPGTTIITFASGGCQIQKTISVYPTPVAIITPLGSTNLCPGDVVALTATTGAGYLYTWYIGATVISGATNSTYITGTAGSYRVTVSTAFCQATSTPVNVTMNPVTAGISPSGVINTCASTPPMLNATPGTGVTYQWIKGGIPIVGSVGATHSASVTGTYSVKVTNGFGCSSTSVVVTVNLTPSPSAIVSASGPLSFCAGNSVTFSTPVFAGETYQWRRAGLPIAGATNASYTATLAGMYDLVVTNTLACSNTSVPMTVTILAGPPATITPSTPTIMCAGGTAILVAPVGPYTYQWYKGGVIIPGATNVSYGATTSGSYTVKVTAGGGCNTTSVAQPVTIVPMPTVSPLSATSFCWGGSVTLTASVSSGAGPVTYKWYKNGVLIPGAVAASYVASTTGLYTVEVTITGSLCSMTTSGTYVTAYTLPNPLITYDGTYFHTGTTYSSYQWYKNYITIPGATTHTRINGGSGSYTVKVIDVHGCQAVSPAYVLIISSSSSTSSTTSTSGHKFGSEEPGMDAMAPYTGETRIFPNPAQNVIHIESAEPVHAYISTLDGKTVIDRDAAKDIDLSSLANGVYIIKLYNANGELVKTEKLVKAGN